MPGIKELKTRIRSIGSTRKITRAMQLVSAAKMRRAQAAAIASRAYSDAAWEMIKSVASSGAFHHPLIKAYPAAKKIGVVLLTSNRGFVGSLNTNLWTEVEKLLSNKAALLELVTFGKKSGLLAQRFKQRVLADFPKAERSPTVEDIYPLARFIADLYSSGEYQQIVLIYNRFISTIAQKPFSRRLLPFSDKLRADLESSEDEPEIGDTEFLFEPEPRAVVEHLIPRIIESQLYQAILESDASEHSARMVMMKNATEAAGELIDDLTLTFNQLRQGKITTELAEITAGRIALE
jgi:F-type H+-transporting ATPase subunit gamma